MPRLSSGRFGLFLLLFGLLGAVLLPSCQSSKPKTSNGPVRLAVLIVFDQMRGDYLTRWDDLFAEEGFHRLTREGAWYQNCHYPYANTVTGAGHASLSTGCASATHGIIGNNWYEPKNGGAIYCASSERYQQVPPVKPVVEEEPSTTETADKTPKSATPERLLVPTMADALKDATRGEGKVVALSMKDRSSVLPGGKHPDVCLWMDHATGHFVTSTYYAGQLPSWVEKFNAARSADEWYKKSWERLMPELDYEAHSGPDDVKGEGKGYKQGVTFPHPFDNGKKEPDKTYYEAMLNSPFGNDLLLDLSLKAIDEEKLGQDDVPDLLTISFSSNDLIGHCWGPDSQEVLDVTLRSDLLMAKLLAALDARVGKGKYILALSADHGVCPLPEVSKAAGKDAARVSPKKLNSELHAYLDKKFGTPTGKTKWVKTVVESSVYLDHNQFRQQNVEPEAAAKLVADWMKEYAGIQTAFTRAEIEAETQDPLLQMVKRSYHPQRSGDVIGVLKPYYLLSDPIGTGTTHGTPHEYDTHVPLLVYGAGVVPGIRKEKVTPQTAASILTTGIKIPPPQTAEYPVPEGLFEKK